jgi:DNA polymerase-3 subunit epsilon
MAFLQAGDRRNWRDAEFLALDFETTSGDPRRAEPLSVGWVVVANGRVRVSDAAYHLIDHDGQVPVASLQIHRLVPAELAGGLTVDGVAERLRSALDGRVAVVHGSWIERALLKRMAVARQPLIDTLAVVRRLDEREGNHLEPASLSAVARRCGVPPLRAHHAFGDALTTALLLLALAGRLERQRSRCVVDDLLRLGRP